MKSKNTVLFLITAFTLATISTLIGCEKQLLIMKMDDTKAPEKESTQIHGIGDGFLYTSGTIIIGHDAETWEQAYKKYTPITTVNDFLVSHGYTSKVRGILPGRFVEVIDIRAHPLPLIWRELQTVPGVVKVQRQEPRFFNVRQTILIQYDKETWEQAYKKYTPITTVNDFLVSHGYTPKVRGIFPGLFIVIDLGKNIDPLPLLGELKTVPGVTSAELNFLSAYASGLQWSGMPRPRLPWEEIPPNKVGKMINGQLFELGVLLVHYDELTSLSLTDMAPPVVAVLKSLSDKGYEPIVKGVISRVRVQVIDLGENLDPSPLLKELTTIPGVRGVRLNTLHDLLDRYTPGKIT